LTAWLSGLKLFKHQYCYNNGFHEGGDFDKSISVGLNKNV